MKENDATLSLLARLRTEMPEIWEQAQVVGQWVWLEFNIPPMENVRTNLKKLGFHWNNRRKCWQHTCGAPWRRSGSQSHPNYRITPARELAVRDARLSAQEYRVVALRECPLPESLQICDTPDRAAEYWRLHVATNPHFNPDCECFVVLLLNTKHRVKGHHLVSIGTLNSTLVHPREVFRAAIICSAAAVVLMHNHPSGDPAPSQADIKVTRELIHASRVVNIEVLDHVIIGHSSRASLRELGLCGIE